MSFTFKEYEPNVLKRLQDTELEILLAVDEVCREYDIPYYLDSGTALGAVRHQGFIPWDDDADIGMLRPDYERFMAIAQQALGDRFVVSNPRINDKQAGFFGKVWMAGTIFETQETKDAGLNNGVYIDVFPYDVLNKDEKKAKKQISIGYKWQKISYLYHSANVNIDAEGVAGRLLKVACIAAHCILRMFTNQKDIIKHLDKAIELGKEDPSKSYVGLSYPLDNPFPVSMLLPTKRIDFEGHKLPVPGKTEDFLENIYGSDWMELPPVEKRRNHAPLRLKFEESA